MRYSSAILLLLAGLAASSSGPVQTPEILLEQLASPDPKARAAASDNLVSLGVAARPAVLSAAHSGNPEVRARAADLILKLPWSQAADPGEVRRVLAQYGQHDPAGRAHDVSMLANFSDHAGLPVLARLLTEDPSESVRWAIVYQLHAVSPTPGDAIAALRPLNPADQPAPVLAGMALAYAPTDQARARQLYQQASDTLLRTGAAPALHLAFGEVLLEHGLRSLARKELETALAMPAPHPPLLDANAHFQLATLIGDSDDRAAADHIKAGIDSFTESDGAGLSVDRGNARTTGNDALADLRAEMHFRYYRAATQSHDTAAAGRHLTKLLALSPSRADVVLEVVPALKQLGRADEAKETFERAYKPLRSAADADPGNAEALNNLAWLCARCGERPDEATRAALKAVELSPDNAAYLDTAAESFFAAGHADQAAAYESKALRLRPNDEFMQAQLKRFQSAAATRPTR